MKLDLALLTEKGMVIERHLARVAAALPERAEELLPGSGATDTVVLHLWLAVQAAIDVGMAACVAHDQPGPSSYADAFRRLAAIGVLPPELAERLVRAVGLRNVIAHEYEALDLARVHRAAREGPADLRALIAALRDAP